MIYLRDFVSMSFFDNCEFVVSGEFAVVGLDEFIKDNYRIAFRIHFLIRILLVVS